MQQNDFPLKASKQRIRGSSTIETCKKSGDWLWPVKFSISLYCLVGKISSEN